MTSQRLGLSCKKMLKRIQRVIKAKEIAPKLIGEEFVWFMCWQS